MGRRVGSVGKGPIVKEGGAGVGLCQRRSVCDGNSGE